MSLFFTMLVPLIMAAVALYGMARRVDVYDALVSKRVYKSAFDFETAVQMILDGKCGVFNPALLESFLTVEGEIRKLYAPGAAGETQEGI